MIINFILFFLLINIINVSDSYCKSPDYLGCFNKCPCPGRWINCIYQTWWKNNRNYWLDKWHNEQRYKAAHSILDRDIDYYINSYANG